MFTIIQSGSYSAILTIPPGYTTYPEGTNDIALTTNLPPTITPVIIPDGCRIKDSRGIWTILFNPPIFTWPNGPIYINPDNKYILTEIIVHELVHWKIKHFLKYLWGMLGATLTAIRKGGSPHDWHPMEIYARTVARQVINQYFRDVNGVYRKDLERVPFDAMAEIQKVLKT